MRNSAEDEEEMEPEEQEEEVEETEDESEELSEEEVEEESETDSETEDETEEGKELSEEEPQEDAAASVTPIDPSQAHLLPEEEELKAASPQDIPLNIVIEVGRLQMSIKTLMELKPGNLLDLNVHPETGVDLVVNGSRVGKGELLQIGDTIGVRILELG